MFFKFSKLHKLQKHHKWPYITKCRHEWYYDFFFILDKIIKRKEEKATVTFLWRHNSVMAFKLFTFYLSHKFDNHGDKKTSLKLFRVLQTNTSFIQIESLVNWESAIQKLRIAHYNVFMLLSLANQKRDILLSILSIQLRLLVLSPLPL